MLPNPQIREIKLNDYIKTIQKRLGLIIAFLIIVPLAVTIFVFTQQPIYKATVSIVIEKTQPKVTRFESVSETPSYYKDQQFYRTQYNILSSRALAERVFDDLHLSKDQDFQQRDAIVKLLERVKIEPIRNTEVVLIHIEDTDALRAATLANGYANAYIRQDIETRGRTAKEAVGWLESQLTGIKKNLQDSEEALNKYVQENKIVTTPDIEKKTETLLENLKRDRAKLETDIAEASKRYKVKHPKMIASNAQLDDLNHKIEQETDRLLSLTQKMVQYNVLKNEVESNQELYISLLTRAKETDVTEKLQASSIRVIDSAKPPSKPYKPQKAKIIFASIFIALCGGVSISLFLEYLDSTIRTAEEVSLYLNLPFLGYIPSAQKERKIEKDRALICYREQKSTIAESFRAIRTSILFAAPEDRPLKNILVTSSIPQEGKSFTSCNLAIIFSHVNERILLIDMDMRRPKLQLNFNTEQKSGLSDFLIGNINLENIIKPTPINNLSLITAGTIPPNPSELLSSAKVRLLFEDLKTRFDRIIVDSPPILTVADTSLLANMVDGVVLVIKGASTRLEVISRSKQKIQEAKGKIIGVIVNNIEPEKEDRYYYYHYYYGEEGKSKNK